jgi:5-deoxy-D-glucuronate isomerase
VYLKITEKEVKCDGDRVQGVKTRCLRNSQHSSPHKTEQSITPNVHNLFLKNACCFMSALELEIKTNKLDLSSCVPTHHTHHTHTKTVRLREGNPYECT